MVDLLKEYTSKKLDLLKMEATEKGVITAGVVAISIMLIICSIFFLVLLNIGIGFLIGSSIGSYGFGFLIVAGFYLILLLILIFAGKPIRNFIANRVLKIFNNS